MNEIGKVSFEGKRLFVATTSLQSRAVTPLSLPPPDLVPKVLRGVIFQPRHHQCSLSEQQLVYSKRYGMVGWSQPKDPSTYRYAHSVWAKERGTSRSLDRSSLLAYKDELLEHVLQQSPATKHGFRTLFKPLGSRDGLQAIARHRLNIAQRPFRNPKPHDFRPLNESIGPFALRTLKTPDPFHIRFKTKHLTGEHCDPYVDTDDDSSIERDLDPGSQFCMHKTPEPYFPPNLFFGKGRYSPAFSSHDAFLDRIEKNIK